MRYDSDMVLFDVLCPCCGATLRVDPETQAVLHHREPEKKAPIEDLQAAVQSLKGEAARRNDIFEKSFTSHLGAEKVREKKFEELLTEANEHNSGKPPNRPFDLA